MFDKVEKKSYSSLRKSNALDFSLGNWEKVLLFFMMLGGLYLTLDGKPLAVLLDVEELEELNRRLKLKQDIDGCEEHELTFVICATSS